MLLLALQKTRLDCTQVQPHCPSAITAITLTAHDHTCTLQRIPTYVPTLGEYFYEEMHGLAEGTGLPVSLDRTRHTH